MHTMQTNSSIYSTVIIISKLSSYIMSQVNARHIQYTTHCVKL